MGNHYKELYVRSVPGDGSAASAAVHIAVVGRHDLRRIGKPEPVPAFKRKPLPVCQALRLVAVPVLGVGAEEPDAVFILQVALQVCLDFGTAFVQSEYVKVAVSYRANNAGLAFVPGLPVCVL